MICYIYTQRSMHENELNKRNVWCVTSIFFNKQESLKIFLFIFHAKLQ